jgi:NADH-quinone oxidoreductase subunit N
MNFAPLRLEIYVAILGIVVFLLDLFSENKKSIGIVSSLGILVILLSSFHNPPKGETFFGSFVSDPFSLFFKRVFLIATFIGFLGAFDYSLRNFKNRVGEYHLLLILSLLGMMFAVSSREIILLFISFELMSIPLYVLAGFLKADERSAEAALKFFIFGAFSSALLLFGFSLLYSLTGTTWIREIALYLKGSTEPLLLVSIILLVVGFGFKIAAVPFHMWVPDTYEGAPTPFVAFLSVAPKAVGFGILFRVFFEIFSEVGFSWLPYFAILSGITMIVGNLLAIPQTNIKRLLSYSGIAHIGYMLLGFASGTELGLAMVLFYFVAYVFSNMGAFLVVEGTYRSEGSDDLRAYYGLAQRAPLLSLSMLLFLLSLGGIPFVIGFWAKLYVFLAAVKAGLVGLVLLGAILTVVALFYYLNVARKMYIEKPDKEETIRVPKSLALAIGISAILVVVLGLYPKMIASPAIEVARFFMH